MARRASKALALLGLMVQLGFTGRAGTFLCLAGLQCLVASQSFWLGLKARRPTNPAI